MRGHEVFQFSWIKDYHEHNIQPCHHASCSRRAIRHQPQATLQNDEFPTPICQFLHSFILKLSALCSLVFIELLGNQDPANEEDLYGRHMTKQCI